MAPAGTLHVVATPLGNLEDISPRALKVLSDAALVACEDTRRTRQLLDRFGIRPPRVISCHRFNERSRLRPVLETLAAGGDVALVSDGGTPGVSDPGALLVEAALLEGLPVSPVPGPCAAAAAVSISGFPAGGYLFAGFLPARGATRRRAIDRLRDETLPLVLYEAPHRIAATLADLLAALGDRDVTLMREATKMHEEVRRSTLSRLAGGADEPRERGEFTIVIRGLDEARRHAPRLTDAEVAARYADLIESGTDRREAFRTIVGQSGRPRAEIYAIVRGAGARRGTRTRSRSGGSGN